jgi:hypothetical protein
VAHEEEDAIGLWLAVGISATRQISRFVENV